MNPVLTFFPTQHITCYFRWVNNSDIEIMIIVFLYFVHCNVDLKAEKTSTNCLNATGKYFHSKYFWGYQNKYFLSKQIFSFQLFPGAIRSVRLSCGTAGGTISRSRRRSWTRSGASWSRRWWRTMGARPGTSRPASGCSQGEHSKYRVK